MTILLLLSFSLAAYESYDRNEYRLSGNMLDLNYSNNGEETQSYTVGYTRIIDLYDPLFLSLYFRGGVFQSLRGDYYDEDSTYEGSFETSGIYYGPSIGLGTVLKGKPGKYKQSIVFLSAAAGGDYYLPVITESDQGISPYSTLSYYYGIRMKYEIKGTRGSNLGYGIKADLYRTVPLNSKDIYFNEYEFDEFYALTLGVFMKFY